MAQVDEEIQPNPFNRRQLMKDNKRMILKYAIAIPLVILGAVLTFLAYQSTIPEFWAVVGILMVGVCIVLVCSEMQFYADKPRKKT